MIRAPMRHSLVSLFRFWIQRNGKICLFKRKKGLRTIKLSHRGRGVENWIKRDEKGKKGEENGDGERRKKFRARCGPQFSPQISSLLFSSLFSSLFTTFLIQQYLSLFSVNPSLNQYYFYYYYPVEEKLNRLALSSSVPCHTILLLWRFPAFVCV